MLEYKQKSTQLETWRLLVPAAAKCLARGRQKLVLLLCFLILSPSSHQRPNGTQKLKAYGRKQQVDTLSDCNC